jgi:hypothetical protein
MGQPLRPILGSKLRWKPVLWLEPTPQQGALSATPGTDATKPIFTGPEAQFNDQFNPLTYFSKEVIRRS